MKNIITIQVVEDPAWVGSISPYRVIVGTTVYRPMTKQEVEDQIASSVYHALWDD